MRSPIGAAGYHQCHPALSPPHSHFAQGSGPARSTDGLSEGEMALARKLLDTTVLHVAEIGREVGYADPAAARRDGGQRAGRNRRTRVHNAFFLIGSAVLGAWVWRQNRFHQPLTQGRERSSVT